MKQVIKKFAFILLVAALALPVSLPAQEGKDKGEKGEKGDKGEKGEKGDKGDKGSKDKKEGEQIIITRKNDDHKIIVEVDGDKVIVNGKEINENDNDDDVTVRRHKIKDVWAFDGNSWKDGDHFRMFNFDENRAMLGVTTDQADEGAEIQSVTKESGAEKAGLKKGDIIMKVGDKKIETPDDLTEAIHDHKPGDKVNITYLRDKKEQKVTAELGKWKGATAFNYNFDGGNNFNMDFENLMPKIKAMPRSAPYAQNWSWSGGGPKLGVSVQDSEDGKGVNVIEVDEDGNAAKAGIREEDVITEVDGKAVNSTDQIAKIIRESKDKSSVKIKLQRKGKTENVEVKIPRKLKTADL